MMSSKFGKILDLICTPPTNYAVLTYGQQWLSLLNKIKRSHNIKRDVFFLFWMTFHLGLSFALTPLSALLHAFGYRFLSVDLKQIGSILWLDLYLRDNLTTKKIPKHKIIVARSRYTDANTYGFNLYAPYVTFIYSPFLRLLLYPFFMNIFFQERVAPYEHTYPMRKDAAHTDPCKAQSSFQRYQKQFGTALCRLPEDEIARGRQELSTLMNFERPFITFHVRDSGFYKESVPSLRNGDVRSCELAIQYLIEQGYNVVRAGTPSAESIDDMLEKYKPHLIDYAKSNIRSDFLDCFLASQCRFYLGGSSGYTSLPAVFETPSCLVNFYNATLILGFGASDLSSFKKFRYIDDDSLVPFHDIVRKPLSDNPSAEAMRKLNIRLDNNTPEEILETVKEFIRSDRNILSPAQLSAKQHMPAWNYCFEAQGNFSNAILKEYVDTHKLNS